MSDLVLWLAWTATICSVWLRQLIAGQGLSAITLGTQSLGTLNDLEVALLEARYVSLSRVFMGGDAL